jgi:ABC-type dipeptide/oligopeptide/nickel transport system permease subunit
MADTPALGTTADLGFVEPDRGRAARIARALWRFARRQPLGMASVVVIILIAASAVFAPALTDQSPTRFSRDILVGPSGDHWMGTNRQGVDIFTRILFGGRVSLGIGLATVVVALLGGTLLGLVAGHFQGPIDLVVSRVAELIITLPAIVFALVLATALGRGTNTVIVAISIIFTPAIFRIMRGAVFQETSKPYIEAASVIGASRARIVFRHILPNLAGLMIVTGSATLPAAILTEAGLSFLGVGVAVGEPSWGGDLGGDARQYFTQAWWIAVFPGLALSLTVLAFNLLGDALRDVLDPRLRGKI